MKFTSLLSNLILENAKYQFFYDKLVKPKKTEKGNKSLMDFETLKAIIFADPDTVTPENFDREGASAEDMNKIKKVGKFTQWLINNYMTEKPERFGLAADSDPKSSQYIRARNEYLRLFMEDLFKVTDDLRKFERLKQYFPQDMRDINKFTPQSLFTYLENFELPENIKKKKEKGELKKEIRKERQGYSHPGGEILLVGNNYTLIKIEGTGDKQREAAGWYGGYYDYENGESRWCTSPPNSNYFMNYASKGPLYVILANDDKGKVGKRTGLPQERYQFHFPDSQFMDRADRQIDLIKFLNGPAAELKDILKPEFAKGLINKGGNKVEITLPDSSAGKFVALYGLEDLFNSLPETIEHLVITNREKDGVAIDVPESLGKFRNLTALMLQNVVRSIPESIGNLTELNFLALPNNKKLVGLPENIIKLTHLGFINMKDSNTNLIIPPKLAAKLSDEGDGFFYVN